MAGEIFLVQDDGQLLPLAEQPYNAERDLQRLLADFPGLISGEQINPSSPRRWLFITQELAIPGDDSGSGRWSLDHLYLDQDGIPTLIEVKRSTDTRARREVVGQMLDYAANAVIYLSVEAIRARFEISCASRGQDPREIASGFLGPGAEEDTFWQAVENNLKSGRIRLIFGADEILPELQRIVEFLNLQMNPAEVIAVEVRQFVGEQTRALVPRVLGQTIAVQQTKAPAAGSKTKRKWDEQSFFELLGQRGQLEESRVAEELLAWATGSGLRVWWGEGPTMGSFFPMLDGATGTRWTFSVWTYGRIEIQFQYLPQENEPLRLELRRRLN